jgi:uncharacterized protein YjbJ (UPF0337 family)
MQWTRIQRNWNEFRGKVKEKWEKLTDDNLRVIDGRRDKLEGKIQQRYGFASDHVRKEVDDWARWQTIKTTGHHPASSSKETTGLNGRPGDSHTIHPRSLALLLASFQARMRNSETVMATRGSPFIGNCLARSCRLPVADSSWTSCILK